MSTMPELCGASLLFVYALARTPTKLFFVAAAVALFSSIAAKLCDVHSLGSTADKEVRRSVSSSSVPFSRCGSPCR